jgi:hypothetical protein
MGIGYSLANWLPVNCCQQANALIRRGRGRIVNWEVNFRFACQPLFNGKTCIG